MRLFPLVHAEVQLALRDLAAIGLIGIGVVAFIFGVSILIDVRRDVGSWRPQFWRFDWTIALTMICSFAFIKWTLGYLILGGSGTLPWWQLGLIALALPWPVLAFRAWAMEGGVHRLIGGNGVSGADQDGDVSPHH